MIASLEDAWQWYLGVRDLTRWMGRMGKRYWENPVLSELLASDNIFRDVPQEEIRKKESLVVDDLNDLCVLLLFSVFEAHVRKQTRTDVNSELPSARHPALQHALQTLHESLEQGSFFRILEGYKSLDSNLVEQVSQVRRYRNWVAHGRKSEPPDSVDPEMAYKRLKRFLELMPTVEGAASPAP